MEQAQSKFSSTYPTQDVNTARRLLQQHQDIKRSKQLMIYYVINIMKIFKWKKTYSVNIYKTKVLWFSKSKNYVSAVLF